MIRLVIGVALGLLAGLDAELVNRALAGQTTESNLRRLRRDALELSPRVVVLLAGTNDILGHWKTRAITQNLAAMIEMARASGASVLACAVPRMDLSQGADVDARAVNAWMERYCAAGRCRYVDYYAALSPLKPGLLADGVHPTAAGYALMAPPLRRALAAALAR